MSSRLLRHEHVLYVLVIGHTLRSTQQACSSSHFFNVALLSVFAALGSRLRLRTCVDGADSGGGGFKRYFEEIATVLKRHFPDVLIDREIVEVRVLQ